MRRPFRCGVFLSFVLSMLLVSAATMADGVIIPDEPEFGWLAIVYHDVSVTINDGVATTHVDQLFRNGTGRDLEGRYVFPLPPGAMVSSFSMWVDGEALEARILDADEARAIYEDYVRRAIDPALLEYIGRDTLSARVFPIPAGGERRVELIYTELLAAEGGTYRYRYPLDTERFSSRPLERVKITIDVETSVPLSAVYSPSHAIVVERRTDDTATGVFEQRDVLPTQDFLLYYSVSLEEIGMTLLTYQEPGEDGYFLLIAAPPTLAASETVIPKDLVFVLDRSGSMSGDKIEQAKEALKFVLQNLNPEDRFAVISFADVNEALQTELTPVSSDAVAAAVAWASQIDAGGMTNINDALELALSLFDDRGRPRFLVFLTDGEPTVGVINLLTIAEHARAANITDARLFVFGVGYDVNTILLDQLAQENRGTTTYVLPGENLEVSLSNFYRKIASPAVADTQLEIAYVDTFDLFPKVLPDIFYGTQLLVLGRYRGGGDAQITLSGNVSGVKTAYTTKQSFPEATLEASFLPRLWAGRKIAHLLDQIRLYGESDELVDEVIRLSQLYGVITPYTSFLVGEGDLGEEDMADALRMAAAPATGASAVRGAAALRTLAESETVQTGGEQVRVVENRTYFLRDAVWTDSTYRDEVTLDIAIYSNAYFDLADVVPWILPHLAIGENVVIRVGDEFVRIGEDGMDQLTRELIDDLTG
jgi:Ca-activated chloride channel family protein